MGERGDTVHPLALPVHTCSSRDKQLISFNHKHDGSRHTCSSRDNEYLSTMFSAVMPICGGGHSVA